MIIENTKLSKRQAEILNLVRKAGGAATLRCWNERTFRPVRALAQLGLVHCRWTATTAYIWIGEGDFPAEGPIEPERVASTRVYYLGLGRKNWEAFLRGEVIEHFSRKPVTFEMLGEAL